MLSWYQCRAVLCGAVLCVLPFSGTYSQASVRRVLYCSSDLLHNSCIARAPSTIIVSCCAVLCCAVCVTFLWTVLAGFSAQSVFFPLYIATFNALWAAYPTLGYGLFEQVGAAPSWPCSQR
jgi:hypothetical protein